jgi:hypothetical protein
MQTALALSSFPRIFYPAKDSVHLKGIFGKIIDAAASAFHSKCDMTGVQSNQTFFGSAVGLQFIPGLGAVIELFPYIPRDLPPTLPLLFSPITFLRTRSGRLLFGPFCGGARIATVPRRHIDALSVNSSHLTTGRCPLALL